MLDEWKKSDIIPTPFTTIVCINGYKEECVGYCNHGGWWCVGNNVNSYTYDDPTHIVMWRYFWDDETLKKYQEFSGENL
jgi:hypothetical protein